MAIFTRIMHFAIKSVIMGIERKISMAEPAKDIKPKLEPVASDGFIQNSQTALRRSSILALTKPETQKESIKEHNPGAVVIIPIHSDKRLATIEHTLRSLANQGEKTRELSIVIADNGISNEGRTKIQEIASNLILNNLQFADARPTSPDHKNPAYARNKAIELVRELTREHEGYRQDGILMVDSDTALLPGAVDELEKTYRNHRDTVAVTSRNIGVPNIDQPTQVTYFKELDSTQNERLLPKLYKQGGHIDVASIAAFGSDVATKTCGLFVDRNTIFRLSKPFVTMPHGSGEDMLFTVALNNMGEIWHNPNAILLDQARETPEQTLQQRKNWGQDHALLFADLVSMGLAPKGLYVLEPRDKVWVEWKVPNSYPITGFIINPNQLKDLSSRLREDILKSSEALGLTMPGELGSGIEILQRLIRHIDLVRNEASVKIRTDLPEPIEPNPTQTRFRPESLIGLLAGNILGMQEIQRIDKGVIPQIVFFGVRQAAKWK